MRKSIGFVTGKINTAVIRTDPYFTLPVFIDAINRAAAQGGSFYLTMNVISKGPFGRIINTKAVVFGPNPETPRIILLYGSNKITAQAFAIAGAIDEVGECALIAIEQTKTGAVGPNPQILHFVLENALHRAFALNFTA
jgi:hypothetical protein